MDHLHPHENVTEWSCSMLFPAIENFSCTTASILCRNLKFDAAQRIIADAKVLSNFNPKIPSGRYRLDLSNISERAVCEKLFLINTWEKSFMIKAERPDVSQHGNYENIRNFVFDSVSTPYVAFETLP